MAIAPYKQDYYDNYGHANEKYQDSVAVKFGLEGLAKALNKELKLKSHLDVGCGMGFMVDSMRRLGVDSYGLEKSEYAVENCVDGAYGYVEVADFVEFVPTRKYDLVTCVEVIEHIEPSQTEEFITGLCDCSDYVYLSSDEDYNEPTHTNVRTSGEWKKLMLNRGYIDLKFSYNRIPWGVLYKKAETYSEFERYYDLQTRTVVINRDKGRCLVCGTNRYHVHEIVPRSAFGVREMSNCYVVKNRCLLCPSCHTEAHTVKNRIAMLGIMSEKYGYKYPEQWFQKYTQE